MVPERLRIKNFMSYRESVPELNFDGIHLACLSGHNGAGKSAMLDAMTWALWGKARITSDDELIAQGAHEMAVDFQFRLDGTPYRVLRQRSLGKRGQTLLELQIGEEGRWRNISGNTIRETQAQIINLLHMEYDTFINSAFLVQGKADEFTRKAPGERKRVLAEILGLDIYERLEARAKEDERDLGNRIHGLEELIAQYRQKVERRPFIVQELEEAQARAEARAAEEAERAAAYEAARATQHRLEARKAEHDQQLRRQSELKREQSDAARELDELHAEIAKAKAITQRQPEIAQGIANLRAAQSELKRFDQLYEEALKINDARKTAQARIDEEANQRRYALDGLRREMQRLEALRAQRDETTKRLQAAKEQQAQGAALAEELSLAREQAAQIERKGQQFAGYRLRQQAIINKIDLEKTGLIATREQYNREVMDLQSQLAQVEGWRRELASATEEQRDLERQERRLAEMRALDQEQSQRLGELQAEARTLLAQGEKINKALALIHDDATACPLCHSEIGHQGIDAIAENYVAERQVLRDAYRAAEGEANNLAKEIENRRRDMARIESKLVSLKTITAKVARLENDLSDAAAAARRCNEAQATLSTLEQQIDSEDFAHDARAELAALAAEAADMLDQSALDSEREAAQGRIAALEAQLRKLARAEADVALLSERQAQIHAAESEWAELNDQALTLQVELDSDDFAHDARAEVAKRKQEMDALGYGKNAHNELRTQVAQLEHWEDEDRQLQTVAATLSANERQAERLQAMVARYTSELSALGEQVVALGAELRELPAAAAEARRLSDELGRLRRMLQIAQQEFGTAQSKVAEIDELASELKARESQLQALQRERERYQVLVRAFGKKGIQAMLIETAIPELEREANELLGRMTDNQMHLRFETIRETKKGDASETLDIHIADAQGTRRYDLYSGGEAFRINFAIRIALSKMLARRAGASLQTLIIDEGFGSQDDQGRERLVEAINAIKGKFERIFVITHIQELKDQFPVQIEIRKGQDGSQWALN